MTLHDHIIARIRAGGPMRLDDYMATCLLHPTLGYYSAQSPFGQAGDFITAPEISQMFGELVGLSLAQSWQDHSAPTTFTLAELGPGRGTMMRDILRATAHVPGFTEAAQVVLIEASARLRDTQRATLTGFDITFADTCDALPDQPLFLVANEFFDALPIRQFQRTTEMWRERQVGLHQDTLVFGLSPPMPVPELDHRLEDTTENDLVELRPAGAPIMQTISTRIARHGGAALIIDYGDWRSLGDTLQALQDHARTAPLAAPGEADLTAHVDFEALGLHAACPFTRLTPQGVFLERLGITDRARALAKNLSGKALETHIAAHQRLTHPAEMGTLFKVMGLCRRGDAPPPGLEP